MPPMSQTPLDPGPPPGGAATARERDAARGGAVARPWLPMPPVTPFTLLAERFTVSRRGLYWATTAALLMSVVLMVTGGVVRVTGSGLGCPDWPTCDGDSITTTAEMGIHGVIEFGNRMLTWVLSAAVGWAIIAARLQKPQDVITTRLAWSQFWMVMLNAVIGGITVITGLNPYTVALHFLAATALLTTATFTWHRVRAADAPPPMGVGERSHRLGRGLLASAAVLVVLGTITTGAGPHAGDSSEVHRIPVDWALITWIHGLAAAATLVFAVLLMRSLAPEARTARFRTGAFLLVLALQGVIGIVQSLTHLPALVVVLHLLGAALVWIGAVRVALDTPRSDAEQTVAHAARPVVA